jgi:Flp pilus assembly protein TadG
MRSRRDRERGGSLAETAIVLTVLLAVLFGIIDFGRAMYTYAFVAQVARQGARWAIVRGSQCTLLDHCNATKDDIQTYVQSLSEGATQASAIRVSSATWTGCPPGSSGHAPGCVVTVTVQYPFNFMLPFMPSNGGTLATINMASSAQMVVSQ